MPTQEPTDTTRGPILARRGMIWFAAGAAVIIATHLLRAWGEGPLPRFGPLVPMVLGAYAVLYGLEKMYSGLRRLQGKGRGLAAACVILLLMGCAGGALAWRFRAPYWGALAARGRGEAAAEKLKTIAERHAAVIQSGAVGAKALDSWKDAARAAMPLRTEFSAALEGARYLELSDGGMRAQAEIDARFYALCLEWMDLYDQVNRSLGESSMLDPPVDWSTRQDDIINRIQALPAHPQEGT